MKAGAAISLATSGHARALLPMGPSVEANSLLLRVPTLFCNELCPTSTLCSVSPMNSLDGDHKFRGIKRREVYSESRVTKASSVFSI